MRRREVSQSYERKCRFRKMRPRHRHEERKSGNPGERCVSFPRFHSFVHNVGVSGSGLFPRSTAADGYTIVIWRRSRRILPRVSLNPPGTQDMSYGDCLMNRLLWTRLFQHGCQLPLLRIRANCTARHQYRGRRIILGRGTEPVRRRM